ncbi:phosphopantetheine-binding protein [Streptomyces sp. NPDC051994]|uniref:acyl carrier protein n=1 Tax=unclassified Streptomyces TaxID=2593676 RepID=UPI0034269F02
MTDSASPVPAWFARFGQIVKDTCPDPQVGEEPDLALPMADLGIDSLGIVNLVVVIEDEYGLMFPQDLLVPEVFATPLTLWDALREHLLGLDATVPVSQPSARPAS